MIIKKLTAYLLAGFVCFFILAVCANEHIHANTFKGRSVSQVFHGDTLLLVEAVFDGDYDKADELLRKGADINQIGTEDVFTPLMWIGAVTNRDLRKMEYMLKNGASPNIRENKRGISVMSAAASGDSKPLLELLLRYGGDANLEGHAGSKGSGFRRNLLILAIEGNREEYFELLLSHGADVNWNIDGTKGLKTVPSSCLIFGRFDWLLYFINKGYKGDLRELAREVKYQSASSTQAPYKQKIVQYLKDKGVDVEAVDSMD